MVKTWWTMGVVIIYSRLTHNLCEIEFTLTKTWVKREFTHYGLSSWLTSIKVCKNGQKDHAHKRCTSKSHSHNMMHMVHHLSHGFTFSMVKDFGSL